TGPPSGTRRRPAGSSPQTPATGPAAGPPAGSRRPRPRVVPTPSSWSRAQTDVQRDVAGTSLRWANYGNPGWAAMGHLAYEFPVGRLANTSRFGLQLGNCDREFPSARANGVTHPSAPRHGAFVP